MSEGAAGKRNAGKGNASKEDKSEGDRGGDAKSNKRPTTNALKKQKGSWKTNLKIAVG